MRSSTATTWWWTPGDDERRTGGSPERPFYRDEGDTGDNNKTFSDLKSSGFVVSVYGFHPLHPFHPCEAGFD
jgi:hypothetical protein